MALAWALTVAGCASLAPPAGPRYSGRLVVQVAGDSSRSFSAGFELSGDARSGQLRLNTPLGTTAAQARWAPGQATLQADGRTQTFTDGQRLVTEALGQPLPLDALFDWLQGRPWPQAPHQRWTGEEPGFDQLGWAVSLGRWQDGWLQARQSGPPVVTVRLQLDRD